MLQCCNLPDGLLTPYTSEHQYIFENTTWVWTDEGTGVLLKLLPQLKIKKTVNESFNTALLTLARDRWLLSSNPPLTIIETKKLLTPPPHQIFKKCFTKFPVQVLVENIKYLKP